MANRISNRTEIIGVKQVTEALKELGSLKGINLAKVTEASADELAARIKDTLDTKLNPVTGNLRESIKHFRSKKNPNYFWVGPDYRRGAGEGGGYHAHFFEYGTVERFVKGGIKSSKVRDRLAASGAMKFKSTGRIQPNKFSFIRPTYDLYSGKIIKDLVSGYMKEITTAAKRKGLDASN